MKDLITSIASILLLMIFVMQFAGSQVTHNRLFLADMAVESFRDTLKEQGRLTEENRENLTAALAEICDCSTSAISVSGSNGDVSAAEGTLLYYEVRFPLENLVVMGQALGISPEENTAWMKQKGWVVSRFEKPDDNPGNSDSDDHGDAL